MTELQSILIERYGGADRWQKAQRIEAVVSTTGLAFRLKGRMMYNRAHVQLDVQQQRCRLTPIGTREDISGELAGHAVRLLDASNTILEERPHARSFFPYGRRLWRWDDLDMAYFANYAFWTYFTFPRLLLREDIRWEQSSSTMLRAHFPPSIETHSPQQDYIVDPASGLLRQHNYTVEVISSLATAAHSISEHRNFDGIPVPTIRRVTPQGFGGKALPSPLLLGINVHEYQLS